MTDINITGKPHFRDYFEILANMLMEIDQAQAKGSLDTDVKVKALSLLSRNDRIPAQLRAAYKAQICLQALHYAPNDLLLHRLQQHIAETTGYTSMLLLQQTVPELKTFAPQRTFDTGSFNEKTRASTLR